MAGKVFKRAPEVAAIAEELIEAHYPDIADAGVRIEYVFVDKHATKNGRAVLGSCKKVTGVNALLATPEVDSTASRPLAFYLVTIAGDIWERFTILEAEDRKRALVDHELAHISIGFDDDTGDVKLELKGHDIEEFAAIITRHGLWKGDLVEFLTDLGSPQLQLFTSTVESIEHAQGRTPVRPAPTARSEVDARFADITANFAGGTSDDGGSA